LTNDARIRRATLADVNTIANHRAAMFLAMGSATPEIVPQLVADTAAFLLEAIPREEYLGWLAYLVGTPERVVAGAGVQPRRVLPAPRKLADGRCHVGDGRQAIVINVYTEPAFRRQGLARRLMTEVLRWAAEVELDGLVLHAAPDGRPLYEQLGFAATNEMRFMGLLKRQAQNSHRVAAATPSP
jgi:GNAT superfamily N-acetyltransferase